MRNFLCSFFILFFFSRTAFAYIDPASGSTIISLIIGGTVLIGVFLKTFWYKLKSLVGIKDVNNKPVRTTENNKNL
ncbi:hypothetical protein HN460_01480 [bacterium]|jgi:hypothetical protein|nr:hypothetical protein [bacterium]MBT3795830.1 hypothetical protein [bacterium]MBT4634373.1 hypothetical protein [bacterium]